MANPRLIDVFGLTFSQDDVGFAIPKLDEDIPLYVDPFLLWNSAEPEYRQLHDLLLRFFGLVRQQILDGHIEKAATLLSGVSEPRELGLGYASGSKQGNNIGPQLIAGIMQAFASIPQLAAGEMRHLEELQLVVPNLAEDRISDTSVSILQRFFLNYTARQVRDHAIPSREFRLRNCFDFDAGIWRPSDVTPLPYDPRTGQPILLAPLDLLRHLPWINYESYYASAYSKRVLVPAQQQARIAKAAVLAYNARHYAEVERYVVEREHLGHECKPDPLFSPVSRHTLKDKFIKIRALPTGTAGGADRLYEDLLGVLLPSLFYPTLELAESRVRTISGAHIRDLIFYNDGKTQLWRDIRQQYDARQPVFELKNVQSLDPDHVDQLLRYLGDEFGRFGVLVSRNPAPASVLRNTVDLHSAKRIIVLCLDDRDLELMLALAESNRDPTEAIKKKYIDFTRMLPR